MKRLGQVGRVHWLWVALAMVVVAKEYWIVDQLGRALHSGGGRLVLCTLSVFLIASPILCLRGGRRQILGLIALDAALTGVSYANLLHFRAFGGLSSVGQLDTIGQLGPVLDALFALTRPSDLWLIADLAILVLIALLPVEERWIPLRRRTAATMMVVGAITIAATIADSPRFERRWNGNTFIVGDIGLASYQVLDLFHQLNKIVSRERPTPELIEETREAFERRREEGSEDHPLFGSASGRDLIVLQLESFQTFLLGLEIDGQRIVPNLEALAEESISFPSFYQQASKGRTSDAQFLANCSLHASQEAAVAFEFVANELRCLPEVLGEQGYSTSFIQSFRPDFWNRSAFNPVQGFARSLSQDDFELDEHIGLGLSDGSFFRQLVPRLTASPSPHYTFTLSLTSHAPFGFDELPRSLSLGRWEGTMVGDYLHSVHYTDRALGQFVDELRAEGVLERALFVIYGDHEGISRRNSNLEEFFPEVGEREWFDIENRVPLLIRLPGGRAAGPRERAGGQIDLAPTLLTLLGFELHDTYFVGRDLLDPAFASSVVVMPDGSALGEGRLSLSSRATMGEARCFRADGRELPPQRCDDLGLRAEEELELSRRVLEADLIPLLRSRRMADGGS